MPCCTLKRAPPKHLIRYHVHGTSALAIKPIWLLVLVLSALIVASLDAAPDLPAIDPHAVAVKAAGKATVLRGFSSGPHAGSPASDSRRNPASVPARAVRLAAMIEPNQPSERKAAVRHGSDLSPPQV